MLLLLPAGGRVLSFHPRQAAAAALGSGPYGCTAGPPLQVPATGQAAASTCVDPLLLPLLFAAACSADCPPVGQPGWDGPQAQHNEVGKQLAAPACLHAVLCSHTYKRAVLFVDNSGADIILGERLPPPAAKLTSCRGVEARCAAGSAAG